MAAKVVLIDTQYVETDPLSFKSVVQRLTGKDCCVAWIEENSFSSGKKPETTEVAAEMSIINGTVGGGYGGGDGGGLGVSMLTKGLSFKDLDRMILEAPPMDELKWLWAN